MFKIIYISIILIFSVSINIKAEIPYWVNKPPSKHFVGISNPCYFLSDSIKSAYMNGLKNIVLSKNVEVFASDIYINSKSFFSFSYSISQGIFHGIILKSFWIDKDGETGLKERIFVLLEWNEERAKKIFSKITNTPSSNFNMNSKIIHSIDKILKNRIDIKFLKFTHNKPIWLNSMDIIEENRFFIIGYSSPGYFPDDTIIYAIRNGLLSLLNMSNVSIKALVYRLRMRNKKIMRNASDIDYYLKAGIMDYILNHFHVEEFWIDKNGEKGKKNSIFVKIVIQ